MIKRLDAARQRWAVARREPGGPRSRPTDLDVLLGYTREWWSRIRTGRRRADVGLTLAQVEAMCDVMGIAPEDVLGREGPLDALRDLAGRREAPGKDRIDAARRCRREDDLAGAAACLLAELQETPSPRVWVLASYLLANVDPSQAVVAARRAVVEAALAGDDQALAAGVAAVSHALYSCGDYEAAAQTAAAALDRAAHLRPDEQHAAWFYRSRSHLHLGRFDEARAASRFVYQLAADDAERAWALWLEADVVIASATANEALDLYQRAFALAERGAERFPPVDRAHLLATVATVAYRAGRVSVARALMPTAVALLDELSTTSPAARALVAGALSEAAAGEEKSRVWESAAAALEKLKARV